MKKYIRPIFILLLFLGIGISLSYSSGNYFYLFNFSYIGGFVSLGMIIFAKQWKYARLMVQFGVGLYMFVFLGILCRENMHMEGFGYYLFLGVFQGVTIHYFVAKIGGPLIFGRGWCGYA